MHLTESIWRACIYTGLRLIGIFKGPTSCLYASYLPIGGQYREAYRYLIAKKIMPAEKLSERSCLNY
jgi:hypothetical protein